jgi:hypothetical protein
MMNDFFTKVEIYDLLDGTQQKIGVDNVTYQILRVVNTKNLTCSNTYAVTVKHRIMINGINWDLSNNYQSGGFNNYPILLKVESGITAISQTGVSVNLNRVFPKTINASVEQSSNISTGDSKSKSNQISTGSNLSNINTFGVDISAGWFVTGPVASVGVNYSHSWENGTSKMSSVSQSNESNRQTSSGNEMSVKDWSAYSVVKNFSDTSTQYLGESIQWNWGQTYPWNIFDYNQIDSGSNILMPASVVADMVYYGSVSQGKEKNILLPPSDLSLYGLDFTMAAEWQVTFPAGLTSAEQLTFQHEVSITQASHSMTVPPTGAGSLVASLTPAYKNFFRQNQPLTLSEYALIPLSSNQNAGISFQSNLFDISPNGPASAFQIRSRGNNLRVTGSGFSAPMVARFSVNYQGPGAFLTISFKVADINTQYSLVLKHWKGQDSGNIVLSCSVNDNTTTFNIFDNEGQGSSNNTNELDLRNFDLKSANFHDYLVLGWNDIKVTIRPQDTSVSSEYVLLALSVEG